MVKKLSANAEDASSILSLKNPLKKEMASHYSIFAWKIPRTEEPGWATVHGVTKSWTQLSN